MSDTERELLDRACVLEKENAELREYLKDSVERRCRICGLFNDDGTCDQPSCDCVVQRWKAALAKASGKEVRK